MEVQIILLCSFLIFPVINGLREFNSNFHTTTRKRMKSISSCCDVESLFNNDLTAITKVRVSDTPGHKEVKEYIISRLNQLNNSRWDITLDTFEDDTPFGVKTFTNIIATLDPHIPDRLVLSAHYDSKYFENDVFVAATDSAVPVALILDLVLTLDDKLSQRRHIDKSLQLMFFDGEEAFVRWSETDSLYGSRHLAEEMNKENGLLSVGGKSGIEAINVLVLLDLLGSKDPYPKIHNAYSSGDKAFARLINIERRLAKEGELVDHTSNYFVNGIIGFIEDDHVPFHRRGVPIVHVIPAPFPRVWHKPSDNLRAIDKNLVQNFKKIFMVFLYEYFHLQ